MERKPGGRILENWSLLFSLQVEVTHSSQPESYPIGHARASPSRLIRRHSRHRWVLPPMTHPRGQPKVTRQRPCQGCVEAHIVCGMRIYPHEQRSSTQRRQQDTIWRSWTAFFFVSALTRRLSESPRVSNAFGLSLSGQCTGIGAVEVAGRKGGGCVRKHGGGLNRARG